MQDHSLGVVVDFEVAVGGDGDNGAAKGSRAVDFERGPGPWSDPATKTVP